TGDLADPAITGRDGQPERPAGADGRPAPEPGRLCDARELADANEINTGVSRGTRSAQISELQSRPHLDGCRRPRDSADWLSCTDGKARPVEPGTFPLAHGIPGRGGRLRAYGNAIVPQVAAELIAACTELQ